MFTPSKPNEEITTLDQSTDRPEWTAAKAEAEPEAVQTRQNIPSETTHEGESQGGGQTDPEEPEAKETGTSRQKPEAE